MANSWFGRDTGAGGGMKRPLAAGRGGRREKPGHSIWNPENHLRKDYLPFGAASFALQQYPVSRFKLNANLDSVPHRQANVNTPRGNFPPQGLPLPRPMRRALCCLPFCLSQRGAIRLRKRLADGAKQWGSFVESPLLKENKMTCRGRYAIDAEGTGHDITGAGSRGGVGAQ